MKQRLKLLSAMMAMLVLSTSFGISVTSRVCFETEFSTCAEDESCCSNYHAVDSEADGCCEVKSVYVKASFICSGEQPAQKIFAPEFSVTEYLSCSSATHTIFEKQNYFPPPLLKSNRFILLSTSKLSV